MDPLHPILPTQPTIPPVVPPPPVRRVDRDARQGRERDASGRRRGQEPAAEDPPAPEPARSDDGDERPHIDITV